MRREEQARRPPRGSVSVRLNLFAAPRDEMRSVLTPPWPGWMAALYELESVSEPDLDPEREEITLSAALTAVKDRLSHRLTLLAWVVSELEVRGWTVQMAGDAIIASRVMSRSLAREVLDGAGVAGALTAVAELDADGWPRLFDPWELTG